MKEQLSPHFNSSEFTCKCGCGRTDVRSTLITRLEQLFTKLNARCIIINSGYRCPNHSKKVGGSATDAHTRGFAADIKVKKQDGTWYPAMEICKAAQSLGFGGIGIINDYSVHVDVRDIEFYEGNHKWYGNEVTGAKYSSFI